jgi:hypothetical protein
VVSADQLGQVFSDCRRRHELSCGKRLSTYTADVLRRGRLGHCVWSGWLVLFMLPAIAPPLPGCAHLRLTDRPDRHRAKTDDTASLGNRRLTPAKLVRRYACRLNDRSAARSCH